jgi:hypothetical protein
VGEGKECEVRPAQFHLTCGSKERKGEEIAAMTAKIAEDLQEQPRTNQPAPPAMALRTYTALRLGSVGVIAVLAIAIIKEYNSAGNCLQGSISAYYYTAVQSVFVGTLLSLGLVMIVLWGKSATEDGFLNLAGLLAAVVAFVPTSDTNRCGIVDAAGAQVDTTREKNAVLRASHDAVVNNMSAYLLVVAAVLVITLAVGLLAYREDWKSITEHPIAYWVPWALALLFLLYIGNKLMHDKPWIYANAHNLSATLMFVFIGLVVVNVGIQKWRGEHDREGGQHNWAFVYWGVAALMVIGGVGIRLFAKDISADFGSHRTFWLEAWEIFLLAIFWILQTRDRWHDGAPPRTKEEATRMQSTA